MSSASRKKPKFNVEGYPVRFEKHSPRSYFLLFSSSTNHRTFITGNNENMHCNQCSGNVMQDG